jgi:hypothetical protein
MSRGHGASRRRAYGRRQSEVRRREQFHEPNEPVVEPGWHRGHDWDAGSQRAADMSSAALDTKPIQGAR